MRYGILFGALGVIFIILLALVGFLMAVMATGASPRAQTRAVVIHPNGRVDIDWRAVETCQTDLCRVARAARCK